MDSEQNCFRKGVIFRISYTNVSDISNRFLKTAIRENQWYKVKKSSKAGKNQKSLIYVSAKF